jgi:hypothetical protein
MPRLTLTLVMGGVSRDAAVMIGPAATPLHSTSLLLFLFFLGLSLPLGVRIFFESEDVQS